MTTDDPVLSALYAHARRHAKARDIQPLAGRTNTVVAAGPYVYRAARPGHHTTHARLAGRLQLARTAARVAPVLVGPVDCVPVAVGALLVTCWPRLHPVRPTDDADVAAALALLHAHDPAAVPALPEWDPVTALEALAGLVDEADLARLRQLTETAAQQLRATGGAEVIVHHDAKRSNVVVTADGPRLVDLDGLRRGPALLDLAIVLTRAAKGLTEDATLVGAYPALAALTADGPAYASVPVRLAVALRAVDQLVWQAGHDPAKVPTDARSVELKLAAILTG